VTVLSNSRDNGAEFVRKCAEVCRKLPQEFEVEGVGKCGLSGGPLGTAGPTFPDGALRTARPTLQNTIESYRMELRIVRNGEVGRIKVLAANPRTARGFSGDLILDEFAFHEDSAAIWEAAEPILASNPDFLCRIASTGNGKHNLFYRMTAGVNRGDASAAASAMADKETRRREGERGNLTEGNEGNEGETNGDFSSQKETKETKLESGPVAARDARQSDRDGRGPQENGVAAARESAAEDADAGNVTSDARAEEADGGTPSATRETRVLRGMCVSTLGYKVSRVPRTVAYGMGVKVYDANTRLPITPEEARAQALDKRAYDQNYECAFADENMTLLTHGLISAAEREDVGFVCEGNWSQEFLRSIRNGNFTEANEANKEGSVRGGSAFVPQDGTTARQGDLYVGVDVGRNRDLTVITVVEKIGDMHFVRGILRLAQMRLPEQQLRLGEVCRLPKFRRCCIDMTGIGLGLTEFSQEEIGQGRIKGINFASTVPLTKNIAADGRARETVRVTEAMATELLSVYEDRRIQHPADGELRDDLRKPEKRTSPGGRVSIAATRDEAGHADHFWSFALALEAAASAPVPFHYEAIPRPERGAWL
jgi:phage FluMu gp28-like protein